MNEAPGDAAARPFAGASRDPVDLSPGSAYEVVTRTRLDELATDVAEIRQRIDALFWLVIGSIVVDIALRTIGAGR